MKVRSVVIDSLNLEMLDSQVSKLESQLEKILAARRNPITLINENGDDLLRKIPKLLDCDLVYTEKSDRPYQGLFTGIEGAGTCSFYLPLDAPYGEESTWLELEKALIQLPYMNNVHILIPKAQWPWLITPVGMLYLKKQNSTYDIEKDTNLNKVFIP